MKAVQSRVSLVLTPTSPVTPSGFIPIFSMTIELTVIEDWAHYRNLDMLSPFK